ncbi:MAG: DUF1189 domain-containing protein [Clostridia bacterium]|nr:DUF1189 domain-containing protein [Clostridia bacterium]
MEREKKQEEGKKKKLKIGFWKKVGYTITKIEKYPDMAAEGLGKAMGYLAKIVAILAMILSLGMLYQTHNLLQEGVTYLQNEFPEFSYEDGNLTVVSENEITISEEDSVAGKIIIDTKTQEEQKINQSMNLITKAGEGILLLKDKMIIKNSAIAGTITYSYQDMFEPLGISKFTKQDVINYANSSQIVTLYVSIFLTIFIYSFMMYLLTTISNVILLSVFGYITTLLAKIKMRYVAIFNMSVYALTLSTILNMLYIGINIFVPFNMEYFQVMYVAVAAIYLVAAILILKTDVIKQQIELMKIAETEAMIKKEMQEKEQKEKEEKEKEEQRKKEKENKKKDKKQEDLGNQPEGSNA